MAARAAVRAEESRLSMLMMAANIDLGIATALAVEQHKFNGELKAAKASAEAAKEAYNTFILGIASKSITK